MKKRILILSITVVTSLALFAQQSTLTRKLVNGKYGFGYPSLTKKDGMGYPLIESLTIPAIYDETTNVTFSDEYEGLIGVKRDSKWGYIDATGATKIPFKYDQAGYFHEGLAPVIVNGKCGFINKGGTVVIPYKYDYATSFTDGLAYVELGGKVGFINKSGVAVVPIKYDKQTDEAYKRCYHCGGALYSFKDGKAAVLLDGKCGVVDAKGAFTECKDEALETIVFKGLAKKDNPTAWIKGDCKTNQDIRRITVNDKERNDISTNYDNQTMFAYLSNIKAGDRFTIQITHAKGCTYTLTRPDGMQLDAGQANVQEKEVKRGPALDSVTFSGKCNGMQSVTIMGNYIQSISVNDIDQAEVNKSIERQGGDMQIVNVKKLNIKKGDKLTIKVSYAKGFGNARLIQGGALDTGK
jgi:hypothetical protein